MRCGHTGAKDTHPRVSLVRRKSKHGSSMCICKQKVGRTGSRKVRQTDSRTVGDNQELEQATGEQ